MNAPEGGFAGDLVAFGLADLIQTIALGGRSGRLSARSGAARGAIWFREGAVVHAESGALAGEPAVFEMLGWTQGDFAVEYGVDTARRSIEREATVLVLEGLRRLDERVADETETAPAPEAPPPRPRRRRRRSTTETMVILAAAVSAVAWIAAAGGSSRPFRVPGGTPSFESPVPALPEPGATDPASDGIAPLPPVEPLPREAPRKKPASPAASPTLGDEDLAVYLSVPTPVETLPALAASSPDPPTPSAALRLVGKSWVESGGIRILVDDAVVYARGLAQKRGDFSRAMRRIVAAGDERFDAEIPVVPGAREVVVEVDLGDGAEIRRETALMEFREGDARTLRVTAGKAVGDPVRVRFE